MSIAHTRIDRFISEHCKISRRAVRLMVAQKRIRVDGQVIDDIAMIIHRFSVVALDDTIIQQHEPVYLMLHKPVGVVCATKDNKHQTVIDLIDHPLKHELHIVGRLDLNTSGLVLLTNDSRWSEQLMSPQNKVSKVYQVTVDKPLSADYVQAFAQGMYFDYEEITTLPAKLTVISTYQAQVELFEGKYHQIKRMFGRFQNKVMALHRTHVGHYQLGTLAEGKSVEVTPYLSD